MNTNEKVAELMNNGVLIDNDNEKDEAINLYYINGFFVEETISKRHGMVTDIIPFKQGYRLKDYSQI